MNNLDPADFKNFLGDTGMIVQIGAFNGVWFEEYGLRDMIFKNKYVCHLIEPLEPAFTELQSNYTNANSEIHFHKIAIYNKNGDMEFYRCPEQWEASFVRHTNAEVVVVPTLKFETFIEQNNITHIDGLFIDVEGVEDVILEQMFENTNIRPNVIRYEFPHLVDPEGVIRYVESKGYTVTRCKYQIGDNVCVRNDLLS